MAEPSNNIEMWLQVDGNIVSVIVDVETAKRLQEDYQYLQHFGKNLKTTEHGSETKVAACNSDEQSVVQSSDDSKMSVEISQEDSAKIDQDERSCEETTSADTSGCDQQLPVVLHKCDICKKEFASSGTLNRHLKNIHKEQTYSGFSAKISCALCSYQCDRYRAYWRHLEQNHNITLECENFIFENEDEFLVWKKEQERISQALFVKNSGTRRLSKDCEQQYFYCHRAGHQRVNPKFGKRKLKAQGSCKINKGCPAKISVIKYLDCQSLVEVEYIKTHVGHTMDVRHICLNAEEKLNLASKLLQGEPIDRILDSVRDPTDGSVKRIHLTTRKDIYNIALQYNINYNKNESEVMSFDLWVKEMNEKGSDSPILLYKPQGSTTLDYPLLQNDDFVLAIMNSSQIEMLHQYGDDIICLDSTRVTSACDFPLTTLMIIDDLRQGFPVAFLISNKQDEITLGTFFGCIKNKAGIIKPKTFMTDISESYYNAWKEVMGTVENRIFCTWHVDKAWKKNLCLIKNKKDQEEVYKALRTLLEEKKQLVFDKMLPEIVQGWLNSKSTKQFGDYFLESFWDQVSCWAYCYRKSCGINTNMHLEAFLKVLKHIHFKGKKIRQLERFVLTLMKYIRDRELERLTSYKGNISKKLSSIKQSHEECVGIDPNNIVFMENEEDTYYLVSVPSENEACEVRITTNICHCPLVCSECNICIHKYICTCSDYCIEWNMCKHIHCVCQKLINEPFMKVEIIDSPSLENNGDQLYTDDFFFVNVGDKFPHDDEHQHRILRNHDSDAYTIELTTENISKSSLNVEKKMMKETLQRLLRVIDNCNPSQLNSIKNLLAPIEPSLSGKNSAVHHGVTVQNVMNGPTIQ